MSVVSFVTLWCLLVALAVSHAQSNFFDYSAEDGHGNVVPLSKYKDAKVILVVNVATNCGFTYTNYQQLIDLYDKYHKRGLEILAFPCNQFGEQEPGSNTDIQNFVKNFGVTFPVFSKILVNGPEAHSVYKFLKNFTDSMELGWNFVKFLVVQGFPVKRYHSRIQPKKIEEEILKYLDSEQSEEL
jgi:glutathione peroxidase